MMKKLMALVLALLMCVCAAAETAQITGEWYLAEVAVEGMSARASDVGMEMTLKLEEGGVGTAESYGEALEMEWTLDGTQLTVSVAGDPMVFDASTEGVLVSESMDGMVMTFTREPQEPIFETAPAVKATDVAQFDGLWMPTHISAYGVYLPYEQVADILELSDPTILIQGGTMVKFNSGVAETGALEDGALVIPTMFGKDDPDGLLGTTVTLLEDGSIELYYAQMYFRCVPVEEPVETAEPVSEA